MQGNTEVDAGLWEEFHRVVNMSSRELSDWLRTVSSGEATERFPDEAAPEYGRRVLAVLQKRRSDLTDADAQTMRQVVDMIHAERGADMETTAGQPQWRRALMTIGHDPLKPVD